MVFNFNTEKNILLFKTRGITFSEIIEVIERKGVLMNFKHPNQSKYPNQMIMVVDFNNYTYCVPYVLNKDEIFLKTIYPNRDFLYLLEEVENE